MRNSTLCYLERDGKYLMLHRVKKEKDINKDKWIGVGGGFEDKESPEDCAKREIFEETGLIAGKLEFRAIVTFVTDKYETEYMHLFTTEDFSGEMTECDEGELVWVPKEEVEKLPIWEGDRIFLKLIADPCPFFSLKLTYAGDSLTEAVLDGKRVFPVM